MYPMEVEKFFEATRKSWRIFLVLQEQSSWIIRRIRIREFLWSQLWKFVVTLYSLQKFSNQMNCIYLLPDLFANIFKYLFHKLPHVQIGTGMLHRQLLETITRKLPSFSKQMKSPEMKSSVWLSGSITKLWTFFKCINCRSKVELCSLPKLCSMLHLHSLISSIP